MEQRTAALRRLSVKLLRVPDEERRRIARELHDSLGQDLTAAKITLDMLVRPFHFRPPQRSSAGRWNQFLCRTKLRMRSPWIGGNRPELLSSALE